MPRMPGDAATSRGAISQGAISHGARCSSKGERGLSKRLAMLRQLDPLTGERLLDIGCADGSYTVRLAAGFEQVDAIDVEPGRLDDFRDRLEADPAAQARVRVARMSADDLAFPDDTFCVATAIEVLEHVGDLDRTFAEVARVLRPGGRFLATTPNRWFPFETHGPIIAGRRRRPVYAPGITWVRPFHRRCSDARAFTLAELRDGAAAHGLTLADHRYMMPPFDRSRAGDRLRPLTDRMEDSAVGFLGMAHVLAFRKAHPTGAAGHASVASSSCGTRSSGSGWSTPSGPRTHVSGPGSS